MGAHLNLLPGPNCPTASRMLEAITLAGRLREIDKLIEDWFRRHRCARVIICMPGTGPLLTAEIFTTVGGRHELVRDRSPARRAGPAAWDSGRIRGNLLRPRRYHRGLNRVSCYCTIIGIPTCPESMDFYDRKRAEGKKHTQAVLALAAPTS